MVKACFSPEVDGHKKGAGVEAGTEVGEAKEKEGRAKQGNGVQMLQGYSIDGDVNNRWGWSDSAANNGGRFFGRCSGDGDSEASDENFLTR